MKKLDVLAIGDTVIDAFIRLNEAELRRKEDGQDCKLCIDFGQKIPYESVEICNAVGNAANASVSAARLGAQSGLLTYLGDDQNGKDCLDSLSSNGVDTELVHIENGKKTNYHYVLWYDVDRTILVKHEEFNYDTAGIPEGESAPKWLYVSSLGAHALSMYEKISAYLERNPDVKLAFQPGVFDMKTGKEKLSFIYKRAEAICVNVEEAQSILSETTRDLPTLLRGLATLGPKHVFITDGIKGAYAYDANSDTSLFMPIYPHEPIERTGAGDAFFSTIITCLSLGKSISEALLFGPINSMSVVQKVGAQKGLLSHSEIEEYIKKAPAAYAPREL